MIARLFSAGCMFMAFASFPLMTWLKENRQSRNDRKFVQKRRAW